MEAQNFQKDVIERSFEKPILVDFWAPWCGPCRMLGPILEELATSQADRWELVKINSDENQEIAARFKVMSIPNVKMFVKGEVIAEFTGALSRQAILNWLDEHIPDARKIELNVLLEKLEMDEKGILEKLAEFVRSNPDIEEARLALAGKLVFTDPEQSQNLVEGIVLGHPQYELAEDIRALVRFSNFSGGELQVSEALSAALENMRANRLEQTIQYLIQAVVLDKSYEEGLPRKACIAIFRILGPQHPLTKTYRRRFDMALY